MTTQSAPTKQQLMDWRPEVGKFAKGHYKKDGKLYTIHGTIIKMDSPTEVTIDNGKRVRVCCHVAMSIKEQKYQTFGLPNGRVARAYKGGGIEVFKNVDGDIQPDISIPVDTLREMAAYCSQPAYGPVQSQSPSSSLN